jgi:glycine/D-amino acid oxidase-like deaminating enzyme
MSRSAPLSEGVEQLILEIDDHVATQGQDRPQFDVAIVGSGYGGAVAAARLAEWRGQDGARLRVCVLERGREFLQGTGTTIRRQKGDATGCSTCAWARTSVRWWATGWAADR